MHENGAKCAKSKDPRVDIKAYIVVSHKQSRIVLIVHVFMWACYLIYI